MITIISHDFPHFYGDNLESVNVKKHRYDEQTDCNWSQATTFQPDVEKVKCICLLLSSLKQQEEGVTSLAQVH